MNLNINNGIILTKSGYYEATFSLIGFPLTGSIISFKLVNVPSQNGLPAQDFSGNTTILGSVFVSYTETINGNCKFIANEGDTIYLVNNTLFNISLYTDINPSNTYETTVNATLDIILIDSLS